MNCSIQLELLVDFFICLNGMIWKFVFRWAEFCFGLGYMAGPGICHWYLTMTRHPETNGKAWNIYEYMALKHISYFAKWIARSNLSFWWISSFVSMGWFGSSFLDELSFVLGWATWPAPEYVIGTWPWLAIPRPMEKPGIYMNIWLWNIFHISKWIAWSNLSFWWISSFVSMGCLGLMPAEQSLHWLDRIEQEKMASTRVVPGLSLLFFNVFSMFNLCSAFYVKVAYLIVYFSFFR